MRTEQLTKGHEPLQKLSVILGRCTPGLSPPPPPSNFTFTVCAKAILLLMFYFFYVLVLHFVLFAHYVPFHILVKFE